MDPTFNGLFAPLSAFSFSTLTWAGTHNKPLCCTHTLLYSLPGLCSWSWYCSVHYITQAALWSELQPECLRLTLAPTLMDYLRTPHTDWIDEILYSVHFCLMCTVYQVFVSMSSMSDFIFLPLLFACASDMPFMLCLLSNLCFAWCFGFVSCVYYKKLFFCVLAFCLTMSP